MADSKHKPLLEAQVIGQLAEIEQRITALIAERNVLQRILIKVRSQSLGKREVSRKNSVDRILVEHKILELLQAATPKPVSTRKLFLESSAVLDRLKSNTFRSYLHRLKQRGQITQSATQQGYWSIVVQDDVLIPHR